MNAVKRQNFLTRFCYNVNVQLQQLYIKGLHTSKLSFSALLYIRFQRTMRLLTTQRHHVRNCMLWPSQQDLTPCAKKKNSAGRWRNGGGTAPAVVPRLRDGAAGSVLIADVLRFLAAISHNVSTQPDSSQKQRGKNQMLQHYLPDSQGSHLFQSILRRTTSISQPNSRKVPIFRINNRQQQREKPKNIRNKKLDVGGWVPMS